MMRLEEFIKSHSVDFTNNLVLNNDIAELERIVGLKFGSELKEYILKYGYLGYKYIELYGINSLQREKSDLISQTLFLHKTFEQTTNYIAIENVGEGDYILVDSDDNVVEFDSELNSIIKKECKLNSYIISRFEGAE